MAFFRKTKKPSEKFDANRKSKEIQENKVKWDELERLISNEAPISSSDANLTKADYISEGADLSSRTSDAQDILNPLSGSYMQDFKVDFPENSEFMDIIPEPLITSTAAASTGGIMPSANTKKEVNSAKSPPQEHAPINAPTAANQDKQATETFIAPPPTNRPDRADIGAMRLDVARISADIQSGEELYRRAQQRIENLTGFVERAEIDFSVLNRLEPENRRLKARNRTIEREIDANVQKMTVLRAELEDREQRLAEKTRVYETTLGKMSIAKKSLQEYERALSNSRESSDRNALNAERLQTSLDVERRENEVLRGRVTDTVSEIDVKQSAYIEAKKVADSLAQDCSDYRHQAESAEKEADELRKNLAVAQTQNNAMKAEMVGLHEDIRTFKSQSEFTIISREDEMAALQEQVGHLTKQLNIKDDIVRNAARDVQELRKVRTAQDLERERLEAQVETQAYQLDQANSEILKTKQDVTDFDRRYRDVATALSVAQSRRMSNEPAEMPDIQPLPPKFETTPATTAPEHTSSRTDDLEGLSSDEISDRIMDFRLGLRDKLT